MVIDITYFFTKLFPDGPDDIDPLEKALVKENPFRNLGHLKKTARSF